MWHKLLACVEGEGGEFLGHKLEAYATEHKLEAYATEHKLEAYATKNKLEAYATGQYLQFVVRTIKMLF